MVNNILNGALMKLGETIAGNLEAMGITDANPDDGLTTLIGRILDIEPSIKGLNLNTSLVITTTQEIIGLGESIILTSTLRASYDDTTVVDVDLNGVLTGATVQFYNGTTLLGTGITDLNGIATYTYTPSQLGNFTFNTVFEGTRNFTNCNSNNVVNVYVYYNTSIDLNVSPEVIDTADTVVVNATLLRDDNVPISGGVVEIYNDDTLLNSSITDEQGGCLNYYNAHDLKRDYGSNLNFKAVFNKTVEYLPSQSPIITKTIKLSEPSINLQYPSAQYIIGDTIPLTFYVTDKMGNLLEGIELVIDILDTQYTGVTDNNGQFVLNYIVSSNGDVVVKVSSVENNYYSSKTISETVTVVKLNTSTVLTSSNSSSNISFVEEFTLSATVSTDISQPIEGTVSFYDNEVLLDNVSLVDNIANYTYSTNEIKEHNFYAVFNESSEYYSSQSNNLTINIVKDTPIINVITEDIYQSWYTACIITDSLGRPLTGKDINIKISSNNSTFSSYPQISDDEGKSKLKINWNPCTVYAQYIFDGDSQYTAVTVNKTFIIKSPLTQSKCTGTMTSGSNKVPYREWVDVSSNCNDNYCKCTNIATSGGSYKRPAALTGSVKFNLPANATVKDLKADWKSKLVKYTSGSGYAKIGAPTITISNDGSDSAHTKTDGTPGKGSYVSGTFNYSGANAAGLNNGVNVKVQFPANTSGEIGEIYFIGVKLTATYIPAQGVI